MPVSCSLFDSMVRWDISIASGDCSIRPTVSVVIGL